MIIQNKNRDLNISGIWQPKWPTTFLTSWYTCPCLIPFHKALQLTWVTNRIWMAEEMVRLLSLDHIQHASFTSVSGPFTLHGKPGFLLWVSSCRQLWGEVHIGGTRSPANLWALQVSYPGRGSTSSGQDSRWVQHLLTSGWMSWKILSHPVRSLPKSWPTETVRGNNNRCFKSLNLGVIS